MIQVYTGNGKGKTTAALGLALRASGHGLRVHIIQFLKGWPEYGEINALPHLPGVSSRQFGRKDFVDPEQPEELDRKLALQAFQHARQQLKTSLDLLILDEINVAIEFGLISLADVLGLLEEVPDSLEVVLTGRWALPEVIERAHLVTEMVEKKHPYQQGIVGRRGIEF